MVRHHHPNGWGAARGDRTCGTSAGGLRRALFTFSVVDVRAVIARGHTDAAANGGFRNPHYGLLPDKDERHGLWIVGDEGVYVLSNGKLAEGQRALAVYADECHPKTNPDYRDYKRRYFGGDDGIVFIDAERLEAMLSTNPEATHLRAEFATETMQRFVITRS